MGFTAEARRAQRFLWGCGKVVRWWGHGDAMPLRACAMVGCGCPDDRNWFLVGFLSCLWEESVRGGAPPAGIDLRRDTFACRVLRTED
ncbi:MAG TPA: hypothetical protein VJ183_15545 [Chloroflexia bacterium]|nr:hypothetical protein [Chloroflexia bacterium]